MKKLVYGKDGIRIEEFNEDNPDEQWFLFWQDQDGFKKAHARLSLCAHCSIWRKPKIAESIATKNFSDFQLTETSHSNLKINE